MKTVDHIILAAWSLGFSFLTCYWIGKFYWKEWRKNHSPVLAVILTAHLGLWGSIVAAWTRGVVASLCR